jgi:general secretion pathway protein D
MARAFFVRRRREFPSCHIVQVNGNAVRAHGRGSAARESDRIEVAATPAVDPDVASHTRSIVLNASKSIAALVLFALGIGLSAPAMADGHRAVSLLVLSESVAQAAKSKAADRKEVETLMAQARAAIKDGKLDVAEELLMRAEKSNVEFSFFHLGDTPKKLRSELSAAKRSRKKGVVERPSHKFSPENPVDNAIDAGKAAAASTPQSAPAGRTGAAEGPDAEESLVMPDSAGQLEMATPSHRVKPSPDDESVGATPVPVSTQEHLAAAPVNSDARRQSDAQLLAARRALAVGDVRRATAAIEAAKKLKVTYGHHDDTPDKVDAAVRKYRDVTEASSGRHDEAARHQLADVLMDQAQQLLKWRDYDEAERLVQHVQGLRVNYGPFEAKPEPLLEKIAASRQDGRSRATENGPDPAAGAQAGVRTSGTDGQGRPNSVYPATQALFDRDRDPTRNVPSAAQDDGASGETASEGAQRLPEPDRIPEEITSGMQLFRQGEEALKQRDTKKAMEYFQQAYGLRDQLDATTSQRLQDRLQILPSTARGGAKPGALLEKAAPAQQLVEKQLGADLAQKEIAADKIRGTDPKKAMELLKEARAMVEASGVDADRRAMLLRRVDRKVADLDKYITDNRAKIELNSANREVLKEVDRRQQAKIEVDEKLAKLVDDFQKLMDEQRYAEADVLAKRARELAPDNPVSQQLIWNSKFVSRNKRNHSLIDDKEQAVWETLNDVERAIVPDVGDDMPYRMPDAKKWADLTKTRSKQLAEQRSRRTDRELEIERSLKTPVSCKFRGRPLSEVLEQLGKLAAVNVHLDAKGLDEEGVSSDTQVTIDLTQDITLKSALHLILEPLHLSYVIKDEVLKITSEQLRDGEVYTHTYNVADLVIPIPNFVPNGRMGLAGALGEAYNMAGAGVGGGGSNMAYLATQDGTPATGMVNPAVMAQINQLMPGGSSGRGGAGSGQPTNMGPGGMGGGAQADFDSLIDLIQTTVAPTTWDEVGGPGSISEFRNNLSLVISQTQDVHEQIVDLLEQLRRNQDLQVTIEVRFITLNDNFFERIGVDFQFNITNQVPNDPRALSPTNKKEIVGLDVPAGGTAAFPNFTSNFAIPFRQSSFNLATPQFGQPVEVAHFGFAILSDLEAFLLVSAAQGDRRSNVLQAPKVTLFNGQQASVFDQTTTPFVISVIPVVGDFAAAYQPVITVLSEGTSLTVQATISNDRRFVRLTVLPFFSQIGAVNEFTFSGSKTTTKQTSASGSTGGGGGDSTANTDNATTSTDGITIQLPNFSFVTVNTTVSVPDGGTVLLGGIKRLSEGRNEFGVPILSKLPYINRLFKNVGIGRETQSLMMMVTPRIIIQEEEEERLGIQTPP